MGSIPLPALDVQQQRPPSALEAQQRMEAIKGERQQQELVKRQVADQDAMTKALHDWDASKGDYGALSASVLRNGGSGDAAFKVMQHGLAVKKQVSDIAKQDAETGGAQLANLAARHDQALGAIKGAEDVPDDQLGAHVTSTVNGLVQSGMLKPEEAQPYAQLAQLPPDQMRQQLKLHEKQLQGEKAQIAQASSEAEQAKNSAAASRDTAETGKINTETEFYKKQGLAPGVTPDMASYADYLKSGGQPKDYAAWKAKQEAVATAPQKIAVAQAEGQARANIEAQMARGSNAALAQVPPHLIAPASAAATKAGEEYAQADSVSQRLQAMMDAARRGNVVSYQLIPQEGVLQLTTSQGVHRINLAEIQNYAGGGSVWQRLEGHLGKKLTGESIPSSVLDDMAEMQKVQAQGSRAKYENSLKTINQTYGANFKSVEMSSTGSAAGRSTPSAGPTAPPVGATHTAMGSDGKRHYTNSKGQDLGIVQ